MNEQTHIFIKIYLSHFILERVDVYMVCEWWVERHIYSEIGLLLPISPSGSQGVPMLAPPCKLVRDSSARLRVPRSTAILYILSKSYRVVLITQSPSGYTPVVPKCPDCAVIFLFTNQNVTACQSTRGHLERTENPCYMLYNKMCVCGEIVDWKN